MQTKTFFTLALATLSSALIRFQCSQLVYDRLDPLVNPGVSPTRHLHQIVGGNAFNATMDKASKFVNSATCTTCQFSEDFSNYWTAVLYFRAQNGTFKRVPQRGNTGFEGARQGGMTVYYMQDGLMDFQQKTKVTSFPPGFRMIVGNPNAQNRAQAGKGMLTYICLDTLMTRSPMIREFPGKPCPAGIMVNLFFPTCWDGKNIDSPDHQSHTAYGMGANCPASHPVRIPQLMLETVWDTRAFNDKSIWPKDGTQPFVWSYGDAAGWGNHGDYVFGWKGDSLKKIMDTSCYVNCPGAKQSMAKMNQCMGKPVVKDQIDGWVKEIPGAVKPGQSNKATAANTAAGSPPGGGKGKGGGPPPGGKGGPPGGGMGGGKGGPPGGMGGPPGGGKGGPPGGGMGGKGGPPGGGMGGPPGAGKGGPPGAGKGKDSEAKSSE